MSAFKIYLSPPDVSDIEESLLLDAFKSKWIAPLGPHVDLFEKEMSDYLKCKSALALNSGTAAIHLALKVLGIQQNDIVLCSSLTFVASANPILYERAQPVFVDSNLESWNICSLALEKAIEDLVRKKTPPKALVAVNLYGQSAQYDQILPLCEKYKIHVVEDAAESLGATYLNQSSGTFGILSALSFNGNKIITTSGGGMLISNQEELTSKARHLSSQARDPAHYYQHSTMGYNYRLSNLLAAVGRGQLSQLDQKINRRREIFNQYVSELGKLPGISFMPEVKESFSTRWLTVMLLNPKHTSIQRDQIIDSLKQQGIESRAVWKPMHLQPLFEKSQYYQLSDKRDISQDLFENGICLPSGSSLKDSEQDEVIEIIKKLFKNS